MTFSSRRQFSFYRREIKKRDFARRRERGGRVFIEGDEERGTERTISDRVMHTSRAETRSNDAFLRLLPQYLITTCHVERINCITQQFLKK